MISIPFSGSKRLSYKNVKPIVEDGGYETVYEPFGGSCVLSANLYNDGVVSRAVVNDYDRLFDIYPEFLNYKDWVVAECLKAGVNYHKRVKDPVTGKYNGQGRTLKGEQRTFLQGLIKQVPYKYWRLLATGGNFCHRGVSSHEKIKVTDFANFEGCISTDKQRVYLETIDRIERDSLDYHDFLEKYSGEFSRKAILIIDPPYEGTFQRQYKSQFGEGETVKLLRILKSLNTDFIFFNHDLEKMKEWFNEAGIKCDHFELTGTANTTANRNRKDVMAYVTNKL